MTKLLSIADRVLMHLLNAVVVFANLAVMALILLLVASRMFGWSVVGMLELATISAMWLYMAGAIIAMRNREHLVVDFLTQSLSPKLQVIHEAVTSVIVLAIGFFFIFLASGMLEFATRRPQTTPALSLPLLIPQSAIVTAAVFTTIYALRDAIRACRAFSRIRNTEVH
ncbi:TRAP transporter small permease [Leisingera aquimarina]|uniref:TRAP transporter small permease n=1 Tax=Leisingera aquimarina TaxID=476529 RepID=UPI00041EB4A9|nr:TRAP transporter small permease subunit [Leisingera aquimarina]